MAVCLLLRKSGDMKKTFPELAALAKSIGREISIARKEHEWSQEQLAAIVDVDRGTIGNFETGRMNPSLLMFVRLTEALKVRPHQVLENAIADFERRRNTTLARAMGFTEGYANAQLVKLAKASRPTSTSAKSTAGSKAIASKAKAQGNSGSAKISGEKVKRKAKP